MGHVRPDETEGLELKDSLVMSARYHDSDVVEFDSNTRRAFCAKLNHNLASL